MRSKINQTKRSITVVGATMLLLFLSIIAHSQPVNKVLGDVQMPSAEALSGAKYGDTQISYFTGQPSVSVDLHTIVEGSLKIPLSLSYLSNGIKLGEIGSWCGNNWSLRLGMVNRTTMGTPDDINLGYYDHNDSLVLPMLENNAKSTQQMLESSRGVRDTEPDLFHATLPGYGNLKWLYDKDNNVVQLPKTDFKITVQRDNLNGGRFTGFRITSPTGVQFVFGKLATDTGPNDGMEYTYYDNIQVTQIAPSGWYLREIRSHDGKDVISYHYSSQRYAYKHLTSCSIAYHDGIKVDCGNGITIGPNKKVINNKIDGFRLDSIRCSVGVIKFVANTDREDVEPYTTATTETAKRLDRLEINDGAFCKAYDFHYSYPPSLSGNTTPENKRLRLDSLQEISCNGLVFEPPHRFDYFPGLLPDRYSKQIDHLGHFNGAEFNENKLNIPPVSVLWQGSFVTPPAANADRSPRLAQTKIGTLKRMTYPTGGYSEFDFELNEVKELTTTGGGNLIVFGELSNCSSSPFDPNCCSANSQTDTMTFTADQLNGATYKLTAYDFVEPTFCPDPIDYLVQVTVKEYGQSATLGTVSFNSCADSTCSLIEPLTNLVTLTAGVTYEFSIQLTASGPTTGLAKATFAVQNLSQVSSSFTPKLVGGLRLKSWLQHDGIDPSKDILRTYDYSEDETSNLSNGLLYESPRYWGYQRSFDGGIQGLTFYAASVAPLGNFNGYVVGYRRVVEETHGAGYTEYLFNAESVIPTSVNEFPYTPDKLRAYDGMALGTTRFNEAGDTVANNVTARYGEVGYEQLNDHIIYRAYEYFIGGDNYLYAKPYTIRTGVYLLGEKRETLDGVTEVTQFGYDPTNHLAPTRISTTNSDGVEYITENDYIFDFPSSDPVYAEMAKRNMIRPVIETRQKIKKNGVETQIGGRRTTYAGYSKTTGTLLGSCCFDADPYVNNISDFEMTWDENGNVVLGDADGWVLEVVYTKYDLRTGQPTEIIPLGWDTQYYTYDPINKQRTSSRFIDHEKIINYYPGSSLISSITDIDGQLDSLEWDDLLRPSRFIDLDSNRIESFQYGFIGNGDGHNFLKITTDFTPVDGSALQQIEVINIKDGLNRLRQQIQVAHSPDQKDVVTAQEYDNQGRVFKQYEPVESPHSDGSFFAVPTPTPHTLTTFEASPLHRVASVTPPDWYATTTEYGRNTTSIRDHFNLRLFAPGELYTQTVTDPDGNQTTTFTDKQGRTVLTRRDSVGHPERYDTYTAFDPKHRPVLVLPPGTETYPFPNYADLIYTYRYDVLDQVVEQKIPDKEKIELLYHPTRDYPVAWRDGNLRSDGKWMVTAFDAYGRETQTGLISSMSTPNPFGLTPDEVWTENFWDGAIPNYFANSQDKIPSGFASNLQNPKIKLGKLTGTANRVIKGNQITSQIVERFMFYDEYGRLAKEAGDNHILTGGLIQEIAYDFADNVTKEWREFYLSTFNRQQDTLFYNYDHQGRPIAQFHQLEGQPTQQLCQMNYTVKDQLKTKFLGGTTNGFLQQIDFTYLSNRFLQSINGTMSADDLFQLNINYTQDVVGLARGRKNGNIASLQWQVKGGPSQQYGYAYDKLDRLTEAKYSLNNNAYGTEYGYDQRGNFTSIKRRGVYSDGLNFLPQVIDLMQFTPTSNNSNKIQTITDNAPCPDNKVIHQALDNTQMHAVATELQADNVVNENADITYQAGTEITLKAGFHAKAGTNFVAKIADCPQSGFETDGFVQRSTDSYLYDANGNRINDPQNNITNVAFNYLNQPYKVTWANGNTIEWLRDGSGGKLQQLTKRNDVEIGKLDYIGGSIEYEQDTLARIYLKDAKLTFNGGVFDKYVYYLKNHLMSTQVVFEDDGNGVAKLLSQHQQYPFGLEMKGDFVQNRFTKKLYNFKEQTFDFGLGWMDFGARFYTKGDVPTFLSIDPLTHIYTYQSPYAYADNNPVKFIDFMGLGSSYNWNTERYEDEDGNEVSWASVQSEYGIGNAAGNDPPNGGVGVSIYHYENAKQNNWDGASFTFGLTLSAGLLADDATGIGVVDDVAIPFVMVGATALTLYDNRKLIKEWADDISKTVTRNYGSGVGFQYTLRATADGYYPTMSWGSRGPVGQTYLNSGEIWKIGETSKGQRYTTRYLNNIGPGVRMVPEFYGTIPQIKLVEKMKIWSYVFRNFNLPPGNKMFR